MNTILPIPTGEGVGLTSACLGMIYALTVKGLMLVFFKPFSKLQIQPLTALQHFIVIYFNINLLNRLLMKKLTQLLGLGRTDELLEEAVALCIAKSQPITM